MCVVCGRICLQNLDNRYRREKKTRGFLNVMLSNNAQDLMNRKNYKRGNTEQNKRETRTLAQYQSQKGYNDRAYMCVSIANEKHHGKVISRRKNVRGRPRKEYMKQIMIDTDKYSYKGLKELSYKRESWRTTVNQSNDLRHEERRRYINNMTQQLIAFSEIIVKLN